ncbi:tyrosine-type recombinase/integrase [Oceanobacillus profundus]|uniref:Site-specific integrase n=2 Tax=Oceanobacillus profundus TaxID=372463 RepID=A0A417YKM1_9BACI|nr:tyrosine-type recombinase/integrase [Oceanobacillus profundus]RHW33857.1 site-specific integrase [Oceanobacillus profundus]
MNANITYRKRGNGWEYRIRYVDAITKKSKEKSKMGFRTKPEAKLAAEDVQRKLQDGYDQSYIMLKDYLKFWIEEYKVENVRKNTLWTLMGSIDNHINPYFKNIELKEVTPSLYQSFLNYLYKDKKLARNTILKVHNAIYSAMKRAKVNKLITDNPCQDALIPGKENNKDIKYIDSDQVDAFLSNAYQYGYIYWIFFKLLIETGMRKGEAAALQWTDIDFKNGTININKSLDFQPRNKDEMFGDTKTISSERIITIRKSVVEELRFHLNWQNQNKKQVNDLYHHDLNLVLCRQDGNFMPKSSLFNAFSRILKLANINPLPIHSLRHTHAVLMLEAGADMKYLQERLGHGSYQITADVYSHVSQKMEKSNTIQYDDYMNKILK